LVPLLGLPILVLIFVATPMSPWALHRADALLATGDLTAAVASYQTVARWSVWPGQSREATWRAASLAGHGAGEPLQARRLYRTFLKAWPEDPRIAQARIALARIEWLDFGQPARAARQYTWAVRAAPSSPQAVDWLQRAGDAWLVAERPDQAKATWRRLIAEHPKDAAGAHLALARLAMNDGETEQAFGHFQAVAVSGNRGPELTLARLGMSLCLEQLGDLEAAVAELDEVSEQLPVQVWQQRRERLIARQRRVSGEGS
jgi:tetratricopeptide (TPR) repeat protein